MDDELHDEPMPHKSGITRKEFLVGGAAVAAVMLSGCDEQKDYAQKVSQLTTPAIIRKNRPNILLINTDQERTRIDLPGKLHLPTHERLLKRGVEFTNFMVTTTPCSPARSVLYTGQHTKFTKILGNPATPLAGDLDTELPTIGHMLRQAGYYTAYKGKWHLARSTVIIPGPEQAITGFAGGTDLMEPYGFSDYSIEGDHWGGSWDGYRNDAMIASDAALWLESKGKALKDDKPWMLAVNLINPHDIMFFDAGGRQQETRIIKNFLQPLRVAPQTGPYLDDLGVPLPRSFYEDDLQTKPVAHRNYIDSTNAVLGALEPGRDEEAWYRFQNYYLNCIRDVDMQMKAVLDALERAGLADNTIIIHTSDHGEMAGSHGLREKGPFMYRENLRVPFTVVHPDVATGRTTAALGTSLDLAPTLLSLAGVSDDEIANRFLGLKGCNLAGAIDVANGKSQRDERGSLVYFGVGVWVDPRLTEVMLNSRKKDGWIGSTIYRMRNGYLVPHIDMSNRGLFRGIYDGRYKFARYFAMNEHHTPQDWETLLAHNELELYDCETDPDEIVNLGRDPERHRDLIMRLNKQLNEAMATEIGIDDGSEFPGPVMLYDL